MKAVRLVVFMMFALLLSGRQVFAQDQQNDFSTSEENTVNMDDSAPSQDESAESTNEQPNSESDMIDEATQSDIKAAADAVINEAGNVESEFKNENSSEETPSDNSAETSSDSPAKASDDKATAAPVDEAITEAVKAEISERRKASGKLDIFDAKENKVRTLDLIEFKSGVQQVEDNEVIQATFRDTSSGDIVTIDIKLTKDDSGYKVKDMTIGEVSQAPKQEAKSEYSDEEVLKFMKDYIDVQAQATGTFDLYDEKKQKMRNLQFVNLDQKVRRYGVITISTAEFTDKNTGETVMVDVNAENRNGLSITAMRLKSIKKAPVAQQ
ncbi:MAG: hypothetical protein JNN05_06260 [Candidatus Omnitrophica bacterium]|nr:hypothetical protein [Candidatus Omnitrophota bacterium]